MTDKHPGTAGTSAVDDYKLWVTLAAAGPKAIAEALTAQEFDRLHVPTAIEDFVTAQVGQGRSVVLTGNAGDGKTHILRRIRSVLEGAGAHVVPDATALMRGDDPAPVFEAWRAALNEGRPFCMAANEYPLFQLRTAKDGFDQLDEVERQCRHRLAYGAVSADEDARSDVIVIDLSLRNPLGASFFSRLIDRLLSDASLIATIGSDRDMIAARNHALLSIPLVRERLAILMARLVAIGHRATVRELWILAARLVFGTSGQRDFQRADWYSETLFAPDARFDLTTALRDVDPARCSHPHWDAVLEQRGASVRSGWVATPPAPAPHSLLDAENFAALKRRFYFEHRDGHQAFALADPDAQDFNKLLSGQTSNGTQLASLLIAAINAAYCPVPFAGREDHLYLWNGHRFHEQPSRSFLAGSRVAVDLFSVDVPRLPSRLLGCFEYQADHIALSVPGMAGHPRLRIDFALYRTLKRLARGLPRKLIPERDIHKLDAFLEKLGTADHSGARTIWSVHLENLDVIQVSLSADGKRYEGVKRYA
ncbi:hypothetical protein NKI59_27015 [Mesorhizobium sp. M0598]|uniref:hypothetical protein n=1 Tax=Mesorhizobium sp. M0598 TaxID=2956968 RepID=UPI00333C9783